MDQKRKHLAFAITDFLKTSIDNNTVSEENKDGLEIAIQCISEAFGIDPKDPAQQEIYSMKPANLLSVFEIFLKTSQAKANVKPTTEKIEEKTISEEDKKLAEVKKTEGNAKMGQRLYSEAIDLYTEAIKLNGQNAIYYANRAAAHSQNGDHESAIEDSKKAIEINPQYSKGYSRLGHAQYCLGKYEDSVNSYNKVLELDPNNASIKQALSLAQSKIAANDAPRSSEEGSSQGMPNLGGMDFASLLKNPEIMKMAGEMMKNPEALSGLMNNPAIANMAKNMDPKKMEEMAKMFGGSK